MCQAVRYTYIQTFAAICWLRHTVYGIHACRDLYMYMGSLHGCSKQSGRSSFGWTSLAKIFETVHVEKYWYYQECMVHNVNLTCSST